MAAKKELDINVIVEIIKANKGEKKVPIGKSNQKDFSTYLKYAKVWEVLIRENWIPMDITRDAVLSIIDSNYRDANGKILEVPERTRNFYAIFINLWKSLPIETRNKIIQAFDGNEDDFDLGNVKTVSGKPLKANIIVKMMKANWGDKQALLSDDDEESYQYYGKCANVWKVLIGANYNPTEEDMDIIRDAVLSIIDSNYRDANGKILEVSERTRNFYAIFINLWKSLPIETRNKIIQAYKSNKDNFDLGNVEMVSEKQLKANIIVKMMKAGARKKKALLSDDDKDLYRYYVSCARVWKVLIEKGIDIDLYIEHGAKE